MKKIKLLLTALLLSVLLAACGTSTESESNDQPNDVSTSTETEKTEPDTDSTEETSASDTKIDGTVVNSDGQNFSITIVDGYELTAEEPNKDLLYNTANDEQSMRIETFSASDSNLDDITNNLKETIQASNETATIAEITEENLLPNGEGIEDVTGYQIDTEEGKVLGYTFESNGLIVKLTIFDTAENPAAETFINMAETIKSR